MSPFEKHLTLIQKSRPKLIIYDSSQRRTPSHIPRAHTNHSHSLFRISFLCLVLFAATYLSSTYETPDDALQVLNKIINLIFKFDARSYLARGPYNDACHFLSQPLSSIPLCVPLHRRLPHGVRVSVPLLGCLRFSLSQFAFHRYSRIILFFFFFFLASRALLFEPVCDCVMLSNGLAHW